MCGRGGCDRIRGVQPWRAAARGLRARSSGRPALGARRDNLRAINAGINRLRRSIAITRLRAPGVIFGIYRLNRPIGSCYRFSSFQCMRYGGCTPHFLGRSAGRRAPNGRQRRMRRCDRRARWRRIRHGRRPCPFVLRDCEMRDKGETRDKRKEALTSDRPASRRPQTSAVASAATAASAVTSAAKTCRCRRSRCSDRSQSPEHSLNIPDRAPTESFGTA